MSPQTARRSFAEPAASRQPPLGALSMPRPLWARARSLKCQDRSTGGTAVLPAVAVIAAVATPPAPAAPPATPAAAPTASPAATAATVTEAATPAAAAIIATAATTPAIVSRIVGAVISRVTPRAIATTAPPCLRRARQIPDHQCDKKSETCSTLQHDISPAWLGAASPDRRAYLSAREPGKRLIGRW
jgi:hypothetical protein